MFSRKEPYIAATSSLSCGPARALRVRRFRSWLWPAPTPAWAGPEGRRLVQPLCCEWNPGASVTLKSLVYSGGAPVSGLLVEFSVDGIVAGTNTSDATGVSLAVHHSCGYEPPDSTT